GAVPLFNSWFVLLTGGYAGAAGLCNNSGTRCFVPRRGGSGVGVGV
ncbi:MAG: hypothetical protein AVDCRST_MAG18-1834, partial [uncultured Thermomicrobiales bacterium]